MMKSFRAVTAHARGTSLEISMSLSVDTGGTQQSAAVPHGTNNSNNSDNSEHKDRLSPCAFFMNGIHNTTYGWLAVTHYLK